MNRKIFIPLAVASWLSGAVYENFPTMAVYSGILAFVVGTCLYLLGGNVRFMLTGCGIALLPAQTLLVWMAIHDETWGMKALYFALLMPTIAFSYLFAVAVSESLWRKRAPEDHKNTDPEPQERWTETKDVTEEGEKNERR